MATLDDVLALLGAKEVQILELNREIQELKSQLESEDESTNDSPDTDGE